MRLRGSAADAQALPVAESGGLTAPQPKQGRQPRHGLSTHHPDTAGVTTNLARRGQVGEGGGEGAGAGGSTAHRVPTTTATKVGGALTTDDLATAAVPAGVPAGTTKHAPSGCVVCTTTQSRGTRSPSRRTSTSPTCTTGRSGGGVGGGGVRVATQSTVVKTKQKNTREKRKKKPALDVGLRANAYA